MLEIDNWLENNIDQVRFADIDGIRWHVVVDIAKILGYSHPQKAGGRLIEGNRKLFDGKTRIIKSMHPMGLRRTNVALNKEGVALFLLKSQTEKARAIKCDMIQNLVGEQPLMASSCELSNSQNGNTNQDVNQSAIDKPQIKPDEVVRKIVENIRGISQ